MNTKGRYLHVRLKKTFVHMSGETFHKGLEGKVVGSSLARKVRGLRLVQFDGVKGPRGMDASQLEILGRID